MTPLNRKALQEQLCRALCKNVRIQEHGEFFAIDSPFYFPDGDAYQVYLEENGTGGLRLSDKGHLLMRISYEMDVDSLFKGGRNTLRRQILAENGIGMNEDNGEIFLDTPAAQLSEAIFTFGQGLTRVYDMLFLNRSRVASVFHEDLWGVLRDILGEEKIRRNYNIEAISEKSDLYLVDFYFDGKGDRPVYLFGIHNPAKARLATISLEHFHRQKLTFDNLLVFQDQEKMPRKDLARLLNAGGETISSLAARQDLERKVLAKAA